MIWDRQVQGSRPLPLDLRSVAGVIFPTTYCCFRTANSLKVGAFRRFSPTAETLAAFDLPEGVLNHQEQGRRGLLPRSILTLILSNRRRRAT